MDALRGAGFERGRVGAGCVGAGCVGDRSVRDPRIAWRLRRAARCDDHRQGETKGPVTRGCDAHGSQHATALHPPFPLSSPARGGPAAGALFGAPAPRFTREPRRPRARNGNGGSHWKSRALSARSRARSGERALEDAVAVALVGDDALRRLLALIGLCTRGRVERDRDARSSVLGFRVA